MTASIIDCQKSKLPCVRMSPILGGGWEHCREPNGYGEDGVLCQKHAQEDAALNGKESDRAHLQSTDTVNHPTHYTAGGIEVIDAIEAWALGFNLGNVVKYIARAGKKDPAKTVEDLKKARWYLDREISRLEAR